MASGSEIQSVINRLDWLKAENLDVGPRFFIESHTRIDYSGIVEYNARSNGQQIWQFGEYALGELAIGGEGKQLALVAHSQGVFGYALIGERIVVVADFYVGKCHKFLFSVFFVSYR